MDREVATGGRVALVIAPAGFRDEELLEPLNYLRAHGFEAVVTSRTLDESTGKLGACVRPDMRLDDISTDDFDGIVFVGGPGARTYFDDAKAQSLARDFAEADKVVGAICVAPTILANAGLLSGRRVTCFDSERHVLRGRGASLVHEAVVVDGSIVTADGPAAATQFAAAVAGALQARCASAGG